MNNDEGLIKGLGCFGAILFGLAWLVSILGSLAVTAAVVGLALDVLGILDVVDFV